MKQQRKWQIAGIVTTVGMIAFIFLNSAQPAEVSNQVSLGFLSWVERFLEQCGLESGFTNHIIRKAGHFAEFFILGILLLGTVRLFTRRPLRHVFKPLFLGLLVPVLDETIQLFVEGRSGQVTDILLDFSGAFSGILIMFCIIQAIDNKKERKTLR